MITEEAAEDILVDLFAHRAEDHADSVVVLQTVRKRVARRRSTRPSRSMATVAAVAAAVVAIVAVSTFLRAEGGSGFASGTQPSSGAGSRLGEDQLTGTCLDMATVLASWGNPKTGQGGIATDLPDGTQCSHEADIVSSSRPQVEFSVVTGERTVYIAASPPGIRTGFLELSATQSAAAAAASGGTLPADRPSYLIVSIPDDNPQTVLVAILQQFQVPG